jgi:membrane associated rhomboid family serine protease
MGKTQISNFEFLGLFVKIFVACFACMGVAVGVADVGVAVGVSVGVADVGVAVGVSAVGVAVGVAVFLAFFELTTEPRAKSLQQSQEPIAKLQ